MGLFLAVNGSGRVYDVTQLSHNFRRLREAQSQVAECMAKKVEPARTQPVDPLIGINGQRLALTFQARRTQLTQEARKRIEAGEMLPRNAARLRSILCVASTGRVSMA